jgi:hypothetical protein
MFVASVWSPVVIPVMFMMFVAVTVSVASTTTV